MRITKKQLRQIINEELSKLDEEHLADVAVKNVQYALDMIGKHVAKKFGPVDAPPNLAKNIARALSRALSDELTLNFPGESGQI